MTILTAVRMGMVLALALLLAAAPVHFNSTTMSFENPVAAAGYSSGGRI